MASNKLTIAEEESIMKTRILTKTTVTTGQAPLKVLTKALTAFCSELETGSPESTSEACRKVLREVANLQLTARKTQAIQDANRRDQVIYVGKKQELQQAIQQAKDDIEARKQQLQQERINRQHNEEYETIKKSIMEHPSRAETQAEIDAIIAEIAKIQADMDHYNRVMDKRRRQFALLLHCIDDLKTAVQEPPPPEQQDQVAEAMDTS